LNARSHVTLVDGLITDCAAEIMRRRDAEGWFDVATLREPYRIEGKKTLGYELAEQLDWMLPDVIVYPTGGGTGLIGMWKAFAEMEKLGWIGSERPRMVVVQSDTCAPIVRAFEAGERFATEFPNARTCASGLRVPRALGDFLILDAVRESGGTAVAVSDSELVDGAREMARLEGIFASPEGGACVPALRRLIADGHVKPDERVVIFNTASGIKYPECFS
jgi:threonine synthase